MIFKECVQMDDASQNTIAPRLQSGSPPFGRAFLVLIFISSFIKLRNFLIDIHFFTVSESDDKSVFELGCNSTFGT